MESPNSSHIDDDHPQLTSDDFGSYIKRVEGTSLDLFYTKLCSYSDSRVIYLILLPAFYYFLQSSSFVISLLHLISLVRLGTVETTESSFTRYLTTFFKL